MKKLLSLVLALALALSAVSAFAEGKERESSTAPPAPSITNMAAAAESYLTNGFRRIQSAEYLPISIISGRKNA